MRPTRNGEASIQMLTHRHGQAGATAAARLRRNLQHLAVEGDGVVAADDPRLFVTEDALEIHVAQRHEGTRRLTGGGGQTSRYGAAQRCR